jgi:hypothetical protein
MAHAAATGSAPTTASARTHLARGQVVVKHPRSGSDNRTQAFGVGHQYDLSKHTALYGDPERVACSPARRNSRLAKRP